MKSLITLILSLTAVTAFARGGSVVTGGRGAVLTCNQAEGTSRYFQIILQPNLVGHLISVSGGHTYKYRLTCQTNFQENSVFCESEGNYRIYIQDYEKADVISNRGLTTKLSCELK